MKVIPSQGNTQKRMAHGGGAYTIPIVVKFNEEGLKVLDKLRGKTGRSTYLRDLVRDKNRSL